MSGQTDTLAPWRERFNKLTGARDWAGLLDAAEHAAVAEPASWEPPYQQGRALMELGELAQAERFTQECMTRFPALPQFAVLSGYVGGRSLPAPQALARWQGLLARQPDAPGLRLGVVNALKAAGDIDGAEQNLQEGLARTPNAVPLLVHHADLAAQRGDWTQAAERWGKVRLRAPDRLDAIVGAVGALRQSGQLERAETEARAALLRFPDDPDLNFSNAAIASARGNFAEAAASLRRVVAASPGNLAAVLGLMGALHRTGNAEDADAVAEAALERFADNEPLLTEHAAFASQRADWPQAAERWKRVYETCPPRLNTYNEYATALEKADRADEADILLSEAIGFAPGDVDMALRFARLAVTRGDAEQAKFRWRKLKQRFGTDPRVAAELQGASETVRKMVMQDRVDESSLINAPMRSSIRLPPKPEMEERLPQPGPTALDLLMTGGQPGSMAVPPRPASPGFWVVMRRLLGIR